MAEVVDDLDAGFPVGGGDFVEAVEEEVVIGRFEPFGGVFSADAVDGEQFFGQPVE